MTGDPATAPGQLLRFLVTGLLSLGVDFGTYVLLHALGLAAAPAAAGGYAVAFAVNFGLNRTWVFGAQGATRRQLGRYLALVLVNLVVTTIGVGWLVDGPHVEYRVAKLAVAAFVAAVNFVVMRAWVFRR